MKFIIERRFSNTKSRYSFVRVIRMIWSRSFKNITSTFLHRIRIWKTNGFIQIDHRIFALYLRIVISQSCFKRLLGFSCVGFSYFVVIKFRFPIFFFTLAFQPFLTNLLTPKSPRFMNRRYKNLLSRYLKARAIFKRSRSALKL